MRIICIRHVEFEGIGIIGAWAAETGHALTIVKPYCGEAYPDDGEFDALIIMGGPMSVNDDQLHPWLKAERELIGSALNRGLPVLGICLGAQLLAHVLGSRVYRNPEKEIGWFPVTLTPEGQQHAFTRHLPETFITFHWHGDAFNIPRDAVHLASSEACRNQAFAYGKALGLQFHMEMTKEGISNLADRCAHEFVQAKYIQERNAVSNNPMMEFNHKALKTLLDEWITS